MVETMTASLGALTANDIGQPIRVDERTKEGSLVATRIVVRAGGTYVELVLPADTLIN